jgi:hypothetical protein
MAGNLGTCSEGRGQRFESSWVRHIRLDDGWRISRILVGLDLI